jgi:SAM-dependent methyltransferase
MPQLLKKPTCEDNPCGRILLTFSITLTERVHGVACRGHPRRRRSQPAPPCRFSLRRPCLSAPDAPEADSDVIAARRDALLERLDQSVTAMVEVCAVYLGERLGLYAALATRGPLTSSELATATDTHERYAREWLEQQALAGILDVEDRHAAPAERRFRLPLGHAEALADPASLNFWAPQARLAVGSVLPVHAVLAAFRTGAGVPFAAYGADLRDGMAEARRVAFLQLMGTEWLPAMPDVHARLQTTPAAQVADVGIGAGWSSIAIAQAYPNVQVDAFDLDEASVALAQRNVDEAGLGDRVHVHLRDASDPALAGRYDLVTVFFCVHDLTDPVAALSAMRQLTGDDGTVLVVDGRVAEEFLDEETNRDVERQSYGFSLLHCLPVGMTEASAAGTGKVMRPDTLRGYARDAGFREVTTLPIDDAWSAFYRLLA